jgi:hypothetical protein
MSVLEFKDRAGKPYYHLERFIVRYITLIIVIR